MIDAPHTGSNVRFDPGFSGWPDFSGVRRYVAALGGSFSGPDSGYPVIMHGDETVVSHRHPQRGMRGLAAAGLSGDSFNNNITLPPGLLIGSLEDVAEQLEPWITRMQQIHEARRMIGRAGVR